MVIQTINLVREKASVPLPQRFITETELGSNIYVKYIVMYFRPHMTRGTALMHTRMKSFQAKFICRSDRLELHANRLALKIAATVFGHLERG